MSCLEGFGGSFASARAIVVDDDYSMLDLVTSLVKDMGVEVVGTATEGHEGALQAMALLPDVVFTELDMPDMSGFDLIADLRRDFPSIRVIALTANYDPQMARKCFAAGASGLVRKDRLAEDLKSELQRLG